MPHPCGAAAWKWPHSGGQTRRSVLLWRKAELVEVGDGVGHGPEADFAAGEEGVVPTLKNAAMVHVDLEAIAARGDLEDAPGVRGNLVTDTGHEGHTLAVLHFEDLDVFLQGVGAGQIVIVGVAVAPDDTAGLHLASGDRFDAHADLAIAEGGVVENGQGTTIAHRVGGDLREDIGLGGGSQVLDDLPAGGAPVVGHGDGPLGRSLAQLLVIEGDDSTGGCRQAEGEQPAECPHTEPLRGNGAISNLTLDSVVAHHQVVRRRPHQVFTSVAVTITAPPARDHGVGRSPWTSQVQTGFMAGSTWSMVVASKAGT